MDNFDFKKYLANNPLTEAYTPGSGWTEDFEYDDMMAHGLTLTADDSIEDLRKVAEDFTDVNYHREAAHLYDAIDAIEAGDRGEAKMYINKFRKEIKTTLAGWDDVNEAQEDKFDIETTEKIAQAIADEFTAEDRELDLKYVVTPGTEESSFDLDVEAGPNTPGPEWKDKNGFGIENYLGDYAGGSFYIKDRIVYNAASRNAKVAYITPEGEIEIISAEDSKADLGMTDDVETDYMERRKEMSDYMEEGKEEEVKEIKSNKMKKSELKEMIKSAFLNEKETFDQAFDRIDSEEEVFPGEKPMKEAEEEDVELEDTEEIDVDTDAETADAGEVDVEADAEVEMTGDKKEVQDNLQAALEAAKTLGDQKLVDQIGNSITFFTRTHVVGKAEVAEADIDVEVNNPSEEAEVGMELKEALNKPVDKLGPDVEKRLQSMGFETKVFPNPAWGNIPDEAIKAIQSNPKLAGIAFVKNQSGSEAMRVMVNAERKKDLQKLRDYFQVPEEEFGPAKELSWVTKQIQNVNPGDWVASQAKVLGGGGTEVAAIDWFRLTRKGASQTKDAGGNVKMDFGQAAESLNEEFNRMQKLAGLIK